MFVDEKTKSLIRYLSANEPVKVDGKYIYPVSSLVSSFNPVMDHWNTRTLKPYLTTLMDMGYISSFSFVGSSSVQIERTAPLLHFDEYQSHEEPYDQELNHQNSPNTRNPSPIKSRIKSFLTFPVKVIIFLSSLAAVIEFWWNYGDRILAYFS